MQVWDVSEGRQPWASTLPLPVTQLEGLDSGVWAIAAAPSGQLLVAGTEEGTVHAWDLRTRGTVWSTRVSQDYVGGLTWMPGGAYVGVAAADGGLSLLEWRREGQALVHVECGAPLRCCIGNDHTLIAGSEEGQLQLWDVGQMTGKSSRVPSGSIMQDGLLGRQKSVDGLYPPLACESKAAVNALCMVPGEGDRKWSLFVGQEDGMLAQFSN
jgi:WD40 repeat protein